MAQHQVGTWTLYFTRWNQTTGKLITQGFEIIDSVMNLLLDKFCVVSWRSDQDIKKWLSKMITGIVYYKIIVSYNQKINDISIPNIF